MFATVRNRRGVVAAVEPFDGDQGRLRGRFEDDERVLSLYGGMDGTTRDLVKRVFNDPNQPVSILVATDAAAEGLNLQRTVRHLLHYYFSATFA